jgi:hypothetical protein
MKLAQSAKAIEHRNMWGIPVPVGPATAEEIDYMEAKYPNVLERFPKRFESLLQQHRRIWAINTHHPAWMVRYKAAFGAGATREQAMAHAESTLFVDPAPTWRAPTVNPSSPGASATASSPRATYAEWTRRIGAQAFTPPDAAAEAARQKQAARDHDAKVIATAVDTYNTHGPGARPARR